MTLARLFSIALAGFLSAAFPAGAEEPTEFKLVILGTGTPNADPDRSGPGLAIIVDGKPYLVDAGPGIVRRAAAAERNGENALAPEKLDTAFLTHLHSDHTLGLPDLIYTPWVLERAAPLRLFGPPGTRKMAAHLQKAFAEDIDLRLNGSQPSTPEGWKTDVAEIKSGGRIFEE
ncbi:MAG TPA: MBL fold metallo-hydrolase, partial [Parvularculaceae bacterium]|nr:MBL fold metallo-hydrolase [Parvularculaceae bacterium]